MIVLALTALSLQGCDQRVVTTAFPTFDMVIPHTNDISVLDSDGTVLGVEFCNLERGQQALRDGCRHKDPALKGIRGFYTLPSPSADAALHFRERPAGIQSVAPGDLIPAQGIPPYKPLSSPDSYSLRRLSAFKVMPSPVMTTRVGWPLVVCDQHDQTGSSRSCTVGFLIEDLFVESTWHNDGTLDQAEAFRIASQLDAKLRGYIRSK